MSKNLLQIGFWLTLSISAAINCFLLAIVIGGIVQPQYHGSPQAPLPLILLAPPSLLFGLVSLVCAQGLKSKFQLRRPFFLSVANLGLIPLLALGTVVWITMS